MKTTDLDHLSNEELKQLFCDFHNNLNNTFQSAVGFSKSGMEITTNHFVQPYLRHSRKVLRTIERKPDHLDM